ncbi:hypothetical protein IV203_020711 [Nitzschia inconspicua]|uniref:Uncharacterized protein n=1 Tax=Nitzschia inconspicua TaxID=303405 RepID=A0A9K3P8Z1_9STRA|nr:hypothetical protein IV203_021599 [Nitzschia inconspicua]KAG7342767.1 hypothetical protein IV203_020711 [Nitzschia inconspicua]
MMINRKHVKSLGNTFVSFSSVHDMGKNLMDKQRDTDNLHEMTSEENLESPPRAKLATSNSWILLHNAERHLLQRQYKEALFNVNRAFVQMTEDHSNENEYQHPNKHEQKDILLLSPCIQRPGKRKKFQFSVLLADEDPVQQLDLTQQLAVIGLQAWHELSVKDRANFNQSPRNRRSCNGSFEISSHAWKQLEPILNYFAVDQSTDNTICKSEPTNRLKKSHKSRCRGLSIDLLIVWIPFWESHGFDKESFIWATEILLNLSNRIRGEQGTNLRTMTHKDEVIWLHYVCNQLPHVKDSNLAGRIMQSISKANSGNEDDFALGASLSTLVENNWDNVQVHNETIHSLLRTMTALLDDDEDERKDEANLAQNNNILVTLDTLRKAQRNLLLLLRKNDKTPYIASKQQRVLHPERKQKSILSDGNTPEQQGCQIRSAPNNEAMTRMSSKHTNVSFSANFSSLSSLTAFLRQQRNRVVQWLSKFLGSGDQAETRDTFPSIMSFWLDTNPDDVTGIVERRRKLQTFALSLALLLLSWKQRHLMRRLSKSIALALLAPIRELVDALVVAPPSHRVTNRVPSK